MNKLPAQQLREKEAHIQALTQAREALEREIDVFNTTLAERRASVEALLEDFNDKIEEAREWLEAIHDDAQQAYDDRSERWQERERGQGYQAWLEELNTSLEPVEIDFPEDLELSADDTADLLEQVPEQPEST
jgi:hypothetical protein